MTFRINKNRNYTVMSNYHLRDKNLSLKAKGLLSFMLSLPDNWDYSMNGLVFICKENITSIRSTLSELEKFNYLKREQLRDKEGKFKYNYLIYEEPYSLTRHIENLHTDNLHTDNVRQINTNEINTELINTNNKDKEDKSKMPLVWELVKRNYIEDNDLDIVKYNDLFNELLKTYDFVQIKIALCYIVKHWKNNNKLDNDDKPIEDKFNYFKNSIINNLTKLNEIIDLDYE